MVLHERDIMALLYDRIFQKKTALLGKDRIDLAPTRKILLDCAVIEISNIADYTFENNICNLMEMPNLRPPFVNSWFEFTSTDYERKKTGYIVYDGGKGIAGGQKLLTVRYDLLKNGSIRMDTKHSYMWRLDPDGKLWGTARQSLDGMWTLKGPEYDGIEVEGTFKTTRLHHVLGMALSFLNTKYVETIDNPPPPKLSKKHERHYGRPLVTYKTIKVNPMSKRYADTGDDEPSEGGIPSRLHICRGHFKDFRHGAGLFGKYRDIFWWDQHLRGDVHEGVVVNDYEVQAPQDSEFTPEEIEHAMNVAKEYGLE